MKKELLLVSVDTMADGITKKYYKMTPRSEKTFTAEWGYYRNGLEFYFGSTDYHMNYWDKKIMDKERKGYEKKMNTEEYFKEQIESFNNAAFVDIVEVPEGKYVRFRASSFAKEGIERALNVKVKELGGMYLFKVI